MSLQTPAYDSKLPPLSPQQQVKPRHFELRMSLVFVAVFMPNGFYLPYFPLWLRESGFGPEQIAVLIAAPMFVRVAAGPTVSALADRAPDRAPVLMLLALLAAGSACGYLLPPVYSLVLCVSLVFSIFWGPHSPLADSLALSPDGATLFWQPLTGNRLYKIQTADLRDASLPAAALAARIRTVADTHPADGLWFDSKGRLIYSNPEDDSIETLADDGRLKTLIHDKALRWPDSFAEGPDGRVYVSASHIQDSPWFKPGAKATPSALFSFPAPP